MSRKYLVVVAIAFLWSTPVEAACPRVTVNDMMGLDSDYPGQFELQEFEQKADCQLSFSANPSIAKYNAQIFGNKKLPALKDRLPAEPLVTAPYDSIGKYGGTLHGLSKATEAGTSDLLSTRHINLVRYSSDLKTVMPAVAKSWSWNNDYTELTFTLRKGHKWSDGEPFTSADVAFWIEDLVYNSDIFERVASRWLFDGEKVKVSTPNAQTVVFKFASPTPGIVTRFAVDFGQGFQPKHFLGQFLKKYNPDADKLAQSYGFESGVEAVSFYYGNSDWKDVPSPLLKDPEKAKKVGRSVLPTLESHILIEESSDGRVLVANPYFFIVDTAGNQLPYIDRIEEEYMPDQQVQNLRIMDGKVDWKQQAVFLEDYPLLKDNESKGDYTVGLAPTLDSIFISFNRTSKDPVLFELFNNLDFLRAMSLALDREEIREIVYLGQGDISQSLVIQGDNIDFIDEKYLKAYTQYDVAEAKRLLSKIGLRDSNGDGFLERSDGNVLTIRMLFATQGAPAQLVELIRDYWRQVGVKVDVKEVTSDEYRASANNNDSDITIWISSINTLPQVSQDITALVPPFGDAFAPVTGFGWAAWKESNGKEGVEPPDYVKRLWVLADQFVSVPLGSPESDKIGAEIIQITADNLLRFGVVSNIVDPYVVSNALRNVIPMVYKSYAYYWTYPYRAYQWWLDR